MFENFRIKLNENCPCGSRIVYRSCCYNREDKKLHPQKMEVYPIKLLKKSIYKTCLYPDKMKCSKNIIGAHALQSNRILSKLSVDNHVIMINLLKKPFYVELDNGEKLSFNLFDSVGVNKATKYPCFCKKHDDEIFADIEKDGCDFIKGNKKQEFLFAYKSFAFEYYQQTINYKQFNMLIKDIPSKLKDINMVRKYRELLKKERDLSYYKVKFEKALLNSQFSNIETEVIEFLNEIEFANFLCISPKYDLYGRKNRIYNRKNKVCSNLFITIFPAKNKSFMLISYFKEDFKYLKTFINQIKRASENIIKFYFNSIIPIYSNNIVLSPRLWNGWSAEIQNAFNYYNNLNGQEWIMLKAISFALGNHKRFKSKKIDYKNSKINMFS